MDPPSRADSADPRWCSSSHATHASLSPPPPPPPSRPAAEAHALPPLHADGTTASTADSAPAAGDATPVAAQGDAESPAQLLAQLALLRESEAKLRHEKMQDELKAMKARAEEERRGEEKYSQQERIHELMSAVRKFGGFPWERAATVDPKLE